MMRKNWFITGAIAVIALMLVGSLIVPSMIYAQDDDAQAYLGVRYRQSEDGALVVMVDFLEREALMQAEPEAYYITPHYLDYPAMLVNLERVPLEELRELLIESWCRKAPKRVLRAWEEAQGSA